MRKPSLALRPTVISTRSSSAAAAAVFDRVLDQVLGDPQQLVAIAGHHHVVGETELELDAHLYGERGKGVADMARDLGEVDGRVGAHMQLLLDARQRQQIVDQPRHPAPLLAHDGQEFFSRARVGLGGALQRLDEAEQRSERSAQFVAGVGDEVGPHALDAPRLRKVSNRQQSRDDDARVGGERRDADLEQPLDRHALAPQHGFGFVAGDDAADGVDDVGRTQRQHQRLADLQTRQQLTRRRVGGDRAVVGVDNQRRVGSASIIFAAKGERIWALSSRRAGSFAVIVSLPMRPRRGRDGPTSPRR